MKKIITAIIIILALLMMCCEPKEPEGEVEPYMHDIPSNKVCAKGRAKKIKKIKKKHLKKMEELGTFTLTAYCSCAKCCGKAGQRTASGVYPKSNHTIATDPKVIPLGTEVVIDGVVYKAEDTGGAIKGNKIDIYFDSHEEALNFGKKKMKVYKHEYELVAKIKGGVTKLGNNVND